METKITLYGASGHGKVIIDILQCNTVPINAVIDDHPKVETLLGVPVVKKNTFDFSKMGFLIISIGNNSVRKRISQENTASFATAIHPAALLSSSVVVGPGTVVMAGAIVNPEVVIGNHCIINTAAVIEHDCKIANFVHVSPCASLAGNVIIDEGSHIGIGAIVIQGIKIGKWATIGAGAVIIKDVPDYAVVVGNPGKVIKYKQENE